MEALNIIDFQIHFVLLVGISIILIWSFIKMIRKVRLFILDKQIQAEEKELQELERFLYLVENLKD